MAMKDTLENLKGNVLQSRKMLLFAGAIIVGGGVYAMTRHPDQQVNRQNIGSAAQISSHLNGSESQKYRDEITKSDDRRAADAAKKDEDFFPTLIPESGKKDDSSRLDLDSQDEKGATPSGPPELPPAEMPHIQTTDNATDAGKIVVQKKKTPRPPRIMVDAGRIQMVERYLNDDMAKMDNFAPGVIYALKDTSGGGSSQKPEANGNLNAGSPESLLAAAKSSASTTDVKFDLPSPGTMLQAHFVSEVDSRTPGVVMGVVDSGPYAGGRLMGSFQTANDSHKLMVTFKQMIVTYTDDSGELRSKALKIDAYAVDPTNLSQGMATYVNRHLMAKIGFQLATSFMQGIGEAIQQSGSSAMMTVSGGSVISQGSKNMTQQMLEAGGNSASQIGSTLQSLFGNVPDTIKIAQGTPFALLFVGGDN